MDRAVDAGVTLPAVEVGLMLRAVIGADTIVVPSRETVTVPFGREPAALDVMLTELPPEKAGFTGPSTRTVGRWSVMISAASSAVTFLIVRGAVGSVSGREYEEVMGRDRTGAVWELVAVQPKAMSDTERGMASSACRPNN